MPEEKPKDTLMKDENRSLETEFNLLSDEAVVRMAREGSSSAYEILISKYKNLAKTVARKYYISGGDNEDVVQEGMIGIFKAIRDFDLEGNVPFKSFAALCIERQIQTAVSGANREKHKILNESISLYSEPTSMDDGFFGADDRVNVTDSVIASKADEPEEVALIRETFSEIKEQGREILSGFEHSVFEEMVKGKTYKEIAEEFGKDPKSVDNAIQRIKKKLGFVLENLDS